MFKNQLQLERAAKLRISASQFLLSHRTKIKIVLLWDILTGDPQHHIFTKCLHYTFCGSQVTYSVEEYMYMCCIRAEVSTGDVAVAELLKNLHFIDQSFMMHALT